MVNGMVRIRLPKIGTNKLWLGLYAVVALLFVLVVGLVVAVQLEKSRLPALDNLKPSVNFTVYIPRELPPGFRIVKDSFKLQDNTLFFQTENDAGSSLIFSQQAAPSDIDDLFGGFATNTRKLQNTAYPSSIGYSPSGNTTLVSMVADNTWIIVTTQYGISDGDIIRITKGLVRY